MENEIKYLDRQFGHSIVSWKIENFCLSQLSEDWQIYSPEFYIRGHTVTKWRMTMEIHMDENRLPYISFRLKRLDYDKDSEEAWVECSLRIRMDSNVQERRITSYFVSLFNENTHHKINLNHIANTLMRCENLVIDLQLLVCFKNAEEEWDECSDLVLKELSEDFSRLFDSGEESDIALIFGRNLIRGHKPILQARNYVFAQSIDRLDPPASELLIWFNDYNAARKAVRFLYTGNLKHALHKPSISVYEFASTFRIMEIMEYYAPDLLFLKSTLKVEEFQFTWTIKDVSSRSEQYFDSPLLTEGITDTSWRLRLDRKRVIKDEELATVLIEAVKGKATNDICVEFALKKNNESLAQGRYYKRLKDKEAFGFEIDKSDALKYYFQDGNLNMSCRLQIFTAELNCSVGSSAIVRTISSKDANYIQLSRDMAGLYQSALYSDLSFFSNSVAFEVHFCILVARCSPFHAAVIGDEHFCPKMEVHILELFLLFLYSGRFLSTIVVRENIYDLFAVTRKFMQDFNLLPRLLIEMLKRSLTIEVASHDYIFATSYSVEDLENLALTCARNFAYGQSASAEQND